MDAVVVEPVRDRRDLRRFVDYMYDRNANDPHWVPPLRLSEHQRLNPNKNPFFDHADVQLLLARREGRVVGRIAGIDDRLHRERYNDNLAMFGFFEAEDALVAHALLDAVGGWAHGRGRTLVRGPVNPSLNESAGLLVDGFDSDPMLLMPHTPPEYGGFIESCGYTKVKDLFAWITDIDRETPPGIARLARRTGERAGLTVHPLNVSEFTREVEHLRVLYNGAWERNWGFVPPTRDEFRRLATELKPILDPRAAIGVEANGVMIACAVAIPDIHQALKGTSGRLFPRGLLRLLRRRQYVDQVRLLLVGVRPDYRTPGFFPWLLSEWHRHVRGGPYKRAELSWVLEDNRDINKAAEMSGARRYKTYRIYQKALI